jgi:hypothetical protein
MGSWRLFQQTCWTFLQLFADYILHTTELLPHARTHARTQTHTLSLSHLFIQCRHSQLWHRGEYCLWLQTYGTLCIAHITSGTRLLQLIYVHKAHFYLQGMYRTIVYTNKMQYVHINSKIFFTYVLILAFLQRQKNWLYCHASLLRAFLVKKVISHKREFGLK